eukprot:g36321.t1
MQTNITGTGTITACNDIANTNSSRTIRPPQSPLSHIRSLEPTPLTHSRSIEPSKTNDFAWPSPLKRSRSLQASGTKESRLSTPAKSRSLEASESRPSPKARIRLLESLKEPRLFPPAFTRSVETSTTVESQPATPVHVDEVRNEAAAVFASVVTLHVEEGRDEVYTLAMRDALSPAIRSAYRRLDATPNQDRIPDDESEYEVPPHLQSCEEEICLSNDICKYKDTFTWHIFTGPVYVKCAICSVLCLSGSFAVCSVLCLLICTTPYLISSIHDGNAAMLCIIFAKLDWVVIVLAVFAYAASNHMDL